jgi:hypothetical protein
MNWDDLDSSWADAGADSGDTGTDYDPVPDGPYVCVVDKVEFRESKSGNPYLNWVLIINGGSHDGRWLFKRNMLANAQNMSFLKRDIAACGCSVPDKLSDLDLKSLLDRKVKITKKTKGDFENIYIDKLVSEVSGAPIPGKEFDDDDIKF